MRLDDDGISATRHIDLTSARDRRTKRCSVLYGFEGSERAGKMEFMKSEKMSYHS
jgi:hypothetical protein